MSNTNTNTMFVLVESFSNYDESFHHNHVSSHDKEKVEIFLADFLVKRQARRDISVKLSEAYNEFLTNYVSATAEPDAMEQYPRWESGIDQRLITEAMRAERNAIIERNNQRGEVRAYIYQQRELAWKNRRETLLKEWLPDSSEEYLAKFAEHGKSYFRDTHFEIEEIPFLA